jgi:glycerate kinase
MAAASGLTLVRREERDPRRATSFGTGELIRAALDQGCRRFIIGIGGSATNDGGAGLIQALGGRLLDKEGKELPLGGAYLAHLERIDLTALDPRLKESRFLIACDVDNPLLGERGASAVYGPQKGATPQMVKELDRALARYAEVIKRDLDKDVANVPGSGAAGGLGAGLMAFLDATLHRGVDLVIEAVGLADKVKSADLVITGEGSVDGQTVYGKTPVGVARVAKSFNKPVVAVAGTIGAGAEAVYGHGVDVVVGILEGPTSLDTAMARAVYYLETTGERLGRLLKVGAGLGCALPRG